MKNILIYPAGCTKGCLAAARALKSQGLPVADHITPEATHLLLDIPSFTQDGKLRSGADFSELMSALPEKITVIGGKLPPSVTEKYNSMDLLADDTYQFENAAITAECALRVAAERIPFTFRKAPVLIVGWGRIGKHLAFLLKSYGSRVSVLSRSPSHRAEAMSFGFHGLSPQELPKKLKSFRILFNTAPAMMIPKEISEMAPDRLKIDLASLPGIDSEDVVTARGLPGILVPESSGQLIADTIARLLTSKEEDA